MTKATTSTSKGKKTIDAGLMADLMKDAGDDSHAVDHHEDAPQPVTAKKAPKSYISPAAAMLNLPKAMLDSAAKLAREAREEGTEDETEDKPKPAAKKGKAKPLTGNLVTAKQLEAAGQPMKIPAKKATPAVKAAPAAKKAKPAAKKVAAPVEEKAPRITSTTHKRSEVLLDVIGSVEKQHKFLALEMADAKLSQAEQDAKHAEFLNVLDTQIAKKVGEKATQLMKWASGDVPGAIPNKVMKLTFEALAHDGELTSGDKGNLYLTLRGGDLSPGTARSQGNQMFQLLPMMKITIREKGHMVPNPDSTIWQMAVKVMKLKVNAPKPKAAPAPAPEVAPEVEKAVEEPAA